jgi:hypothetical protein
MTALGNARVLARARLPWAPMGLAVLPLVVSAVALLVLVRSEFRPIGDYALTEMHVRDIGRHEVLVGLYSRADWAHPGPLLFYMTAPFYWLTGRASIGMNLEALAVNGLAVSGMALIAWRRGGASMLLCTLLAVALVMRALGAEFLYDPWNNYVVTLPFGLMLFATWALLCGDRWALPIATITATFLAQTHVGNVILAVPLLVFGVAWLVIPVLRRGTDAARKRNVVHTLLISAAIGVVLWLPVAVDALLHRSSNLSRIQNYFQSSKEGTHSAIDGWKVISGQFAWPPESLTYKRTDLTGFGESSFLGRSGFPWLLLLVAAAAVVVWRRRRRDRAGARYLVVVLGLATVLGVVAVMRTLGPVLDYRLRWTWMLPVVAFVLVAWTAWQLAVQRWPRGERAVLIPASIAVLVVVTGVNVVTAGTAGTPWRADSEIMAELTPPVLDMIKRDGGQVVLSDAYSYASWYTRGLVLQLERAGVDARVPANQAKVVGRSRVYDSGEPMQASLVVMMDKNVTDLLADPNFRLVARWKPAPETPLADAYARRREIDRALKAGTLTINEYTAALYDEDLVPPHVPYGTDIGVFESLRADPVPFDGRDAVATPAKRAPLESGGPRRDR